MCINYLNKYISLHKSTHTIMIIFFPAMLVLKFIRAAKTVTTLSHAATSLSSAQHCVIRHFE